MIVMIIPIFNRLRDLKSFKPKEFKNTHFIFVNDHSTDGSEEYIRENFRESTLLTPTNKDLFWGGAIDEGIRHIKDNIESFNQVNYFGYMNIDVKINVSGAIAGRDSKPAIYFMPYRLGTKKCHYGAGENLKKIKFGDSDYLKQNPIKYIGGFFCIFPMKFIKESPSISKSGLHHYHGDYYFSSYFAKKNNLEILPLNHCELVVDRTDKKNLNNKSIHWLIGDIRSPYNLKQLIIYLKLCHPKNKLLKAKLLLIYLVKILLLSSGLFRFK